MPLPTLYGSPVSPHVRAARITFMEKTVDVVFSEVGIPDLGTDAYAAINPFRKMPALVAADVTLCETPALMVYADAIGSGAALEPTAPAERATMWKFMGVAQHQLYPRGVMELYFHRVLAARFGVEAKPEVADAAVAPVTIALDVLEDGLASSSGLALAGGAFSLADIYCGAMVDYVARSGDGAELIAARPQLAAWLAALRQKASFSATLSPVVA